MLSMNDQSPVFLADASDRIAGIKKLLAEFELHTDGTVALKANYNSDDPFPATTVQAGLLNLSKSVRIW